MAWRVLAVLVGLELTYVLGANAFLRSNGLVALVQGAEGVKLDYASAYSVVPGRVHVERLRLRFEDYNVQFQVVVDKGTLDISLSELFFRKFHILSLLADGVSFRMRHKSQEVGSSALRFAAYPPIEGFADPPLYHGPQPLPTPDDEYNLWEVHIEQVVAHARELWVLEYRYQGDAEARGSFLVRPERFVQVEPAALQLRSGTLSVGEAPVARQVSGRLSCSLPSLDVKNTVGSEVFRNISSELEVELRDGDARFLDVYSPPSQLTFGGSLSVSLHGSVKRGLIQPGSFIQASSPAARLQAPQVSATSQLALQFGRFREDPQLESLVTLRELELESPRTRTPGPTAQQLDAAIVLTGVDLARPITLTGAQLKTEARLGNLAWFETFFEAESGTRLGGSAVAKIDLKRGPSGGTGSLDLSLTRGKLTQGSAHVESDVHALARFRIEEEPAMFAQGAVSFRASDGDTLLSLAVGPTVQKLLTAGLSLGALDGTVAFHAAPHGLELELTRAQCGNVSARGHLRSAAQGQLRAAALLSAGPARVGLRVQGTKLETSPLVGQEWLEETWRELRGVSPGG